MKELAHVNVRSVQRGPVPERSAARSMRIHIQDFSGHPFQVQLSRALARRGHEVLHSYSAEYVTGRGRLTVTEHDPGTLRIEEIRAGRAFDKYSRLARLRFETAYSRALRKAVDRWPADVIVLCNIPLLAQRSVARHLRRSGQRYVLWHQDVYSLAMSHEIARSLPHPLSDILSRHVCGMEKAVLRSASGVVAIAESFVDQYRQWKIEPANLHVVPNWAPIDEITPAPRANGWARRWPEDCIRLLYAGTLGRKHNPLLLIRLLEGVRSQGVDARLIVASEGVGADAIVAAAAGDPAVTVLPFQSPELFPQVLATGDVLVALLEPEASRFSVPSKVASYLAAGRPVVLFGPSDNPAARDLKAAGGLVLDPDESSVDLAAKWVVDVVSRSPGRWQELCGQARNYAVEHYDVERVANRFERLLRDVA